MHFLLFIPGAENKPKPGAMADVGLADMIPGGESIPVQGPDGQHGLLIAWRKPGKNEKMHFNANEQTWVKSLPMGDDKPAGRYWVGFWNDSPVIPDDLVRTRATWGEPVTLGDGQQWVLPVIQGFPRDVIRNPETGDFQTTVQEKYHHAHFQALSWQSKIVSTPNLSIPYADIVLFVEEVLRLNYRILPEVSDHLKLFNTGNLQNLLLTIIGLAELQAKNP